MTASAGSTKPSPRWPGEGSTSVSTASPGPRWSSSSASWAAARRPPARKRCTAAAAATRSSCASSCDSPGRAADRQPHPPGSRRWWACDSPSCPPRPGRPSQLRQCSAPTSTSRRWSASPDPASTTSSPISTRAGPLGSPPARSAPARSASCMPSYRRCSTTASGSPSEVRSTPPPLPARAAPRRAGRHRDRPPPAACDRRAGPTSGPRRGRHGRRGTVTPDWPTSRPWPGTPRRSRSWRRAPIPAQRRSSSWVAPSRRSPPATCRGPATPTARPPSSPVSGATPSCSPGRRSASVRAPVGSRSPSSTTTRSPHSRRRSPRSVPSRRRCGPGCRPGSRWRSLRSTTGAGAGR